VCACARSAVYSRFALLPMNTHRWIEEVSARESPCRRPLLRRRPRMGGNQEGREPGCQKLEVSAAVSIEWASRQDLQFHTAMTEVALFTSRKGHKTHLRPKLTTKMKVGNGCVQFKEEVTRWLGVCIDPHLTFKEHHNRCMKKARGAEARLRALTRMRGIVPDGVRAVQIPCIRAGAV
jgi:hypothetical protein